MQPTLNSCYSALSPHLPVALKNLVEKSFGFSGKIWTASAAQIAAWELNGHVVLAESTEREKLLLDYISNQRTMCGMPLLEMRDVPITEVHLEDGRGNVLGKITNLAVPIGFEENTNA